MSGPRKEASRQTAPLVTLTVAAAVLAVLLVVRPDRWLATVGSSPGFTPASSAGHEPSSGPPSVDGPWGSLAIMELSNGPVGAESVVVWSSGYVAVGLAAGGAAVGWTSGDGRAWEMLPPDTFGGLARRVGAAAAFGGVIVGVERPTGIVDLYRRTAGTWTQLVGPRLGLGESQLAGTASSLLGIEVGDPNELAFTADGASWQVSSPPGLNRMDVGAVAAFGDTQLALGARFVPVALTGRLAAARAALIFPAGWWSSDGVTWREATIPEGPTGRFGEVHAGASGLVALTFSGGAPSFSRFWQSADGRSWTISDADPLGVWPEGEGQGSANGLFRGDGARLLVVGQRARDEPAEAWVSFDGLTWDQLAVSGDAAEDALEHGVPYLLRDGVLFVELSGSRVWLGVSIAP